MIFYTSDLHFGHENIIKSCGRPFSSADEMDEALIAAWNARVTRADTVYILGDLIYKAERPPEYYLKRLKGKKYLIVGNHDGSWLNERTRKYFQSISPFLETTDGRHALTLCHYAMVSYHHDSRAYMIHGHMHNNLYADYYPLLIKRERVLNAGVDINGFKPVTFEELCENNRIFKENAAKVLGIEISDDEKI